MPAFNVHEEESFRRSVLLKRKIFSVHEEDVLQTLRVSPRDVAGPASNKIQRDGVLEVNIATGTEEGAATGNRSTSVSFGVHLIILLN